MLQRTRPPVARTAAHHARRTPSTPYFVLQHSSAANMLLIAFGVVVCALGEANLVMKGLMQQLIALLFEVGGWADGGARAGGRRGWGSSAAGACGGGGWVPACVRA